MNKENFAITYFNTRAFFLGVIYSLIFALSGKDAVIASIIGAMIGSLIIFLNYKLKLNEASKILSLLLSSYHIIFGIIVIETFINSFFLTSTPKTIIIIPTLILVFYNARNSLNEIKHSAFICLLIAIIFLLVIAFSLIPYINYTNLLPMFTAKKTNILKASIIFGMLSSSPSVSMQCYNFKRHIKDYLITCSISIFIEVIIISCLTINVTKMYSFPEYMILKRIKFFEFIENVENILTSIWYFDMFYLLTLNFKNIKRIVIKDKIYYPYIILLAIIATFVISKNYYQVLYLYHYCYIIVSFIIFLMIFKSIWKRK